MLEREERREKEKKMNLMNIGRGGEMSDEPTRFGSVVSLLEKIFCNQKNNNFSFSFIFESQEMNHRL